MTEIKMMCDPTGDLLKMENMNLAITIIPKGKRYVSMFASSKEGYDSLIDPNLAAVFLYSLFPMFKPTKDDKLKRITPITVLYGEYNMLVFISVEVCDLFMNSFCPLFKA